MNVFPIWQCSCIDWTQISIIDCEEKCVFCDVVIVWCCSLCNMCPCYCLMLLNLLPLTFIFLMLLVVQQVVLLLSDIDDVLPMTFLLSAVAK